MVLESFDDRTPKNFASGCRHLFDREITIGWIWLFSLMTPGDGF
jgi:hypothetical protein